MDAFPPSTSCILEAGRFFGEISMINKNGERSATIIVDQPTVLILIDRDLYTKHLSDKFATEIIHRSSFVATNPLFRSWPSTYRNLLAENLQLRKVGFGDYLVKQGDPLESVYFITGGQAEVTVHPPRHLMYHAALLTKAFSNTEEEIYSPFKPINVMERRKLRKDCGYTVAEQRYREFNVCTIGSSAIVGEVEVIMELNCHTASVRVTQELQAYEIDLASFTKIILKKNPETYEKIKKAVLQKLHYRDAIFGGEVPIYRVLLTEFDKAKPKDNRKKIIKQYKLKKESKKPVCVKFFVEMSKGISTNHETVSRTFFFTHIV